MGLSITKQASAPESRARGVAERLDYQFAASTVFLAEFRAAGSFSKFSKAFQVAASSKPATHHSMAKQAQAPESRLSKSGTLSKALEAAEHSGYQLAASSGFLTEFRGAGSLQRIQGT